MALLVIEESCGNSMWSRASVHTFIWTSEGTGIYCLVQTASACPRSQGGGKQLQVGETRLYDCPGQRFECILVERGYFQRKTLAINEAYLR